MKLKLKSDFKMKTENVLFSVLINFSAKVLQKHLNDKLKRQNDKSGCLLSWMLFIAIVILFTF